MIRSELNKRDNSFDIIRLIAAIMVIYSHHFALNGMKEPSFLGVGSFGSNAVLIFFSISGFLISQSFLRSKSYFDYAKKRFLRVYPGLIICLIFTIYICAGFLGKELFSVWITSFEALKTFFRILILTGVGVVGVAPEGVNFFTYDYIFSNTVNGSLWTLFFEVFDYIAVAFSLALFRNKSIGVLLLLAGSIVLQVICIEYEITKLALRATSLFTIPFATGALLFLYKDKWINNLKLKASMLMLSVIIIYISQDSIIVSKTIYSMVLCFITILIGLSVNDTFIKGRFDISYGTYIYAFPIQQIIINEFSFSFWISMFVSLIVILPIAGISWLFVEKPLLRKKSNL